MVRVERVRHIVFGVDPVGILPAICLLKEMIFYCKTFVRQIGIECLLGFGDIDIIFKVTEGLRMLKYGLSTPFSLNQTVDSYKYSFHKKLGLRFATIYS